MVLDKLKKNTRRKKADAELAKMKADIDKLEATIMKKRADVQADFQQRLDELHDKAETVRGKLKELETSTGTAWDETRQGVAKAFHDLESACHRASQELKNR